MVDHSNYRLLFNPFQLFFLFDASRPDVPGSNFIHKYLEIDYEVEFAFEFFMDGG